MSSRILIVDDDASVGAAYALALELDGHTAHVVERADDAMRIVQHAPPDAILVDLRMPFISGVGFLYRLREIDPQVPVAIVTGVTDIDEETRAEIRQLGATLHHKPVPLSDLQTIARRLLARVRTDDSSC